MIRLSLQTIYSGCFGKNFSASVDLSYWSAGSCSALLVEDLTKRNRSAFLLVLINIQQQAGYYSFSMFLDVEKYLKIIL